MILPYTVEEIKKNINEVIAENYSSINKVILFGSYAKKEATVNSDIDLIIDSNEKLMGFKLFSFISKIEELFGKEVDAFEKSEIIKGSLIDKEIMKFGVVVYER